MSLGGTKMIATKSEQQSIERWIDPNPHQWGRAEARLKQYGVSVWVLASHWYYGVGDVDVVTKEYDLPREVVEAMYAYYRRHRSLIDARILLDDDSCAD